MKNQLLEKLNGRASTFNLQRSLFLFFFIFFSLGSAYEKFIQIDLSVLFFKFWIVELILDWFVRGYVCLKLFKLKQDQAPSLKRRSTHSFNKLVPNFVSVHTSNQEKLYNYTTQ